MNAVSHFADRAEGDELARNTADECWPEVYTHGKAAEDATGVIQGLA
jgi:hypothetical protein